MWGTSKYLSESLKRIKRGQNVGNTLQDYVNWYLNSECWSLLLLVQIPSSWLGSQPEAMTSAFETWKCEAWCPYLTAAHARNPRIHKIGNAWSWISWDLGGLLSFFLVVLAGGKVTQDHVTCGLIRCMFAFGCSSQKLKICTKRCGFDCVTFDSMRKLERA